LAKLDKGDGVAKRICNKSTIILLDDPVVGLNPCFAEAMFEYPEGWTDLSK
jgi:ABC-type transporter Mla maintaining outer membrane lipid asymmetry ATPase subunit MlaF